MEQIDLHVHSNASDGTYTPTEVILAAKQAGLSAIALTDHDTVAGIQEAKEAAKIQNIELIVGSEFSCHYQNTEIHILGFFLDETNEELLTNFRILVENRKKRNLSMIEKFNLKGIPITLEMLYAGNPDTVITRAHFARALLELGIVSSKDQAFQKYLNSNCPFYVPRPKLDPKEIISVIKKAGGMAFLAHPMLYHLGYQQVSSMLDSLIEYGLEGVEVYHSSNHALESSYLKSMALSKNLLISGGSDFHGSNKPDIAIGKGRGNLFVPYEVLENIKQARFKS
ncbi:MAG: PHP domain-containing protein [Lachnospiraceae bacterium]|nr:PHP domain-containing protein [Lachnospiraceae bacterium]